MMSPQLLRLSPDDLNKATVAHRMEVISWSFPQTTSKTSQLYNFLCDTFPGQENITNLSQIVILKGHCPSANLS